MGLLFQSGKRRGCGWWSAVALVGLCCCGVGSAAVHGRAAQRHVEQRHVEQRHAEQAKLSAWDAAVEARKKFEAEPAAKHTKEDYARVMDGFREIYHADPGAAHAARAVEQVAELLAEQGRELDDAKSLRDAAGQYEFLAKAYPGGSLAAESLGKALDLLGPEGARDAVEARKVRALLGREYPKYAQEMKAVDVAVETPTSQKRDVGHPAVAETHTSHKRDAVEGETSTSEKRDAGHPAKVERTEVAATESLIPAVMEKPVGPEAVVTGIRHWSTSSYTRVAIDLNVDSKEDVKYEAARVENPDRIFFDLHHTRLAPQLAGKSFDITDDGFLQRIRAAQYSDEVTRVVLDVHQVAEYSAFLLPNPYRLIIDIHGKDSPPMKQDAAADRAQALRAAAKAGAKPDEAAAVDPGASSTGDAGAKKAGRNGGVEVSSLPPMPVTDGSASFGLPVRNKDTAKMEAVAQPRVVMSSKPTVAKPVPNTVTKSSKDTGFEVAAVSLQQGKVEATRRPTSRPIAEKSTDDGVSREQTRARSRHGETLDAGVLGAKGSDAGAAPAVVAPPMADGETSLVRALGLKIGRIVIDAGHGGHDSGTLGAGGIEEKDVVLDVALRLGKLLHDRLGAEIVYTRADDTFIPLETRTAIANKAQADLFISVHANSSVDTDARGVEVYYLNFTSDPEAMKVASRENAVSTESVHELSDLVKKIALKDKIDESKELAADVDSSLYAGLRRGNSGLKDRGVKKAPFVVLIGANMPSILAEISFVTNPEDAAELETPDYRERVAESLYKGVARYAAGINGMKPKVRTTEQASR